jgi:cell division protein FtsI (penicillin-binding protein 3)
MKRYGKNQDMQNVEYSNCKDKNIQEFPVNTNIMPSVVGMSVKDATYLLEKLGLIVHLNGRGIVRSQSISKGDKINKRNIVVLELS